MTHPAPNLYCYSAALLDGTLFSLGELRGRVLLIVNTASQCKFTPQYAGLEALYRRYSDRGLMVLGFPCNQFAGQEPGSAAEIGRFCALHYGVSFPLFARIEVNGAGTHPLYRFLKKQKPGGLGRLLGGRIPWNFTKFLAARDGNVVGRYSPRTAPEELTPEIERLLG